MINRNLGGVICDNTAISNVPTNAFKYEDSAQFIDCGQTSKFDNDIEELLKIVSIVCALMILDAGGWDVGAWLEDSELESLTSPG